MMEAEISDAILSRMSGDHLRSFTGQSNKEDQAVFWSGEMKKANIGTCKKVMQKDRQTQA